MGQGVVDVYVKEDNPYAPFSGSTKVLESIPSWYTTGNNSFIFIAADGSEGKTEFHIRENLLEPNFALPFSEMEASIFTPAGFDRDPEHYGEITGRTESDGELILTYNHPKEFPAHHMDDRSYEAAIMLWAWEENLETGDSMQSTFAIYNFDIYRPPVLFVHGLWSSGNSFQTMDDALYNSGLYGIGNNALKGSHSLRADYSASNASFFLANQGVVPQALAQLLRSNTKLIAHKADVVCHSMGGILTRMYLQNTLTPYSDNIHKLITCNTPHSGAQSANLLLDSQFKNKAGESIGADYICPNAVRAGFGNCYQGAVADLQVATPGNGVSVHLNGANLNANSVPSFALTTTDAFSEITSFGNGYHPWLYALSFHLDTECIDNLGLAIFDDDYSDMIVAQSSQTGGIQASSTTNITNQIHNGSTANSDVVRTIIELLNKPADDPAFSTNGFNPPIQNYETPKLPCGEKPARESATVNITHPSSGDQYSSGATFGVELEFSNNVVSTLVIVEGDGETAYFSREENGVIMHTVELDAAILGNKTISAIGFDEDGIPIAISNPVEIEIQTNAQLESLSVYPNSMIIGDSGYGQIRVYGQYDDGIKREITKNTSLDFSFTNDNAVHNGDGIIGVNGVGQDTLTISLDGLESETIPLQLVDVPDIATSTYEQKVDDEVDLEKISIYPNPASNSITTDLEIGSKMEIITLDGKVVFIHDIESKNDLIDISNLSSGAYIIKGYQKHQLSVGKLIVQ